MLRHREPREGGGGRGSQDGHSSHAALPAVVVTAHFGAGPEGPPRGRKIQHLGGGGYLARYFTDPSEPVPYGLQYSDCTVQ